MATIVAASSFGPVSDEEIESLRMLVRTSIASDQLEGLYGTELDNKIDQLFFDAKVDQNLYAELYQLYFDLCLE